MKKFVPTLISLLPYIIIVIPVVTMLFYYKFGPPMTDGLAISVTTTASGTRYSRKFNSVLVELHNFSSSNHLRDINIDTHSFSLVDTQGNSVGTLDFTGLTTPALPESFVLKRGGDVISGYVTFVDTAASFNEGTLIYTPKDKKSREIKIPVIFKLPVSF